jgi:hypothetical protein
LSALGVPSPLDFLHLTTATRNHLRSAHTIPVPSEPRMAELKCQMGSSHGTVTRCFAVDGAEAAFILDPLKLVRLLRGNSLWVAVGGDFGGKHTKLGVTYMDLRGASKYITLLVLDATWIWQSHHR